MTTESDIRRNVEREVEWEPGVDGARIGVAVHDGAVTLTGEVRSYMEKWRAVKAAERVYGVRAVADEITVKLPTDDERSDSDIAATAARALEWNAAIPK